MDLLLQFEKPTLAEIRNELLSLHPTVSESYVLNAIGLKDFCAVFLKRFPRAHKGVNMTEKNIKMLCRVFDSVDADSRGVIAWNDFTNYCLRTGRNRFRPNTKQSVIEYFQRMDIQLPLPVRKMCFIQSMQLLYCFDNDASIVRILKLAPK